MLARLAGEDQGDALWARVDGLRVHDLVEVAGEVISVRHDRILEFAYERMPVDRRGGVHLRIARTMAHARETDADRYAFPDGEIGTHFLRGGQPAEACTFLLAGGRKAFRVQALDEAVTLLERAEQTLVDLGETAVGGRMDEVQDLLLRSVYARSPTRALPIAERAIDRYRGAGWLARIPRMRQRLGVPGLILGLLVTLVSLKLKVRGFGKADFLGLMRRFLVASTWRAQGLAWASRFEESLAVASELELYAPGRSAATVASRLAGSAALMFQGRFEEQARRLDVAYDLLLSKLKDQFNPYDRRVAVRGAVGGGRGLAAAMRSEPEALRWLEVEDGVTEDLAPVILEGVGAMVRVCYHAIRGEVRAVEAEHRRYLESRALIRPEEREELQHWMAWAAIDRGEVERAQQLAEGFRHRGDLSEAWRGLVRSRTGGAPLARMAAAEEAVAAASRSGTGSPFVASLARLALADAHLDGGAPGRARDVLSSVLELASDPETSNPWLEMTARRRLALAALADGDLATASQEGSAALELATACRNPLQRAYCLRTLGAIEAASLRHADADRLCSQAAVEFEQLDNDHQLRLLRDLIEDPSATSGTMLTTTMTLTGVPFLVEGISPAAVVELMASLDVERVCEALLTAIEERLPEHRPVVFMPPEGQRGARTFGLDAGGELTDVPESVPLRVLALVADAPRMTAELIPVGDGWVLPLHSSTDPLAESGGRTVIAIVYLEPEPESVPEATVRELLPLVMVAASALRNAMRHEELLQREYRITLMHQLAQVLGAVRNSGDLVRVILDRMIDIGRADQAFIMLKDSDDVLAFSAARSVDRVDLPGDEFQVSGSLIEDAMAGGEIVHVQDEADLSTRHSIHGLSLRSVTVVPLRSMVRALADPVEVDAAQQTLLAVQPEELGSFLADTASARAESIGVVYLESRRLGPGGEPDRTLLRLLADQAGFALDISRLQEQLVAEAAEQERLKQRQAQLARYMSADVAEAVMARPELLHLGGARRTVTVLFSDVRGFTAWASRHSPEVVVGALNRIFSVQTEVLFAHGGTLDKFLGDGLMALFGAPIRAEDHAARAVAAATEMQRRVREVLAELASENEVAALSGIGIGVHTGEAAVGNIGSEARMEYTAIGDSVNLASRLCDMAMPGQVLVSQATVGASGLAPDCFRGMEAIQVKGRAEPIEIAVAVVDR